MTKLERMVASLSIATTALVFQELSQYESSLYKQDDPEEALIGEKEAAREAKELVQSILLDKLGAG